MSCHLTAEIGNVNEVNSASRSSPPGVGRPDGGAGDVAVIVNNQRQHEKRQRRRLHRARRLTKSEYGTPCELCAAEEDGARQRCWSSPASSPARRRRTSIRSSTAPPAAPTPSSSGLGHGRIRCIEASAHDRDRQGLLRAATACVLNSSRPTINIKPGLKWSTLAQVDGQDVAFYYYVLETPGRIAGQLVPVRVPAQFPLQHQELLLQR